MALNPTPCKFLQWDTDFFGFRIGRVDSHRLTAASVKDILEWQEEQDVECLYFLANFEDPQTIRLAQANGFQLADVRVTLERTLERNKGMYSFPFNRDAVRPFQPEDLPCLEAIAKKNPYPHPLFLRSKFSQGQVQVPVRDLDPPQLRRLCRPGADSARGRTGGWIHHMQTAQRR